MKALLQRTAVAGLALAAIACLESTSPSNSLLAISDALVTLPAGFSSTDNTFPSGDGNEGAFMPPRRGHDGMGGRGMMGGGMGPGFVGGIGFGRGFDHGPFGLGGLSSDCALNSATGRVTCPAATNHGLTVNRSYSFKKADGTVQSAPDSTTNTINEQVSATGTVTRRDSAVSNVSNSSDRTVTGLAFGSTQRTVNGTSRGQESTTGTNSDGAFTATRLVGDTTSGLVIPVVEGKPTYPTAGTVTRSMHATFTVGGTTTTHDRREVITYNGSATATITITQDGTTKSCTLPLPHGRPDCS
ncbi:MAG TPA: hypothetical protein VNC11_04625 [Gemmatimonadaceae bacterium]|jgi:hypothetical protein|nr:hypothetical protein [Gemmatimonadaceae bacterium]